MTDQFAPHTKDPVITPSEVAAVAAGLGIPGAVLIACCATESSLDAGQLTRFEPNFRGMSFEDHKSPDQIDQSKNEMKKINDSLEQIVLKNCQKRLTQKQVKRILRDGKIIGPKEMLAYGFVDEVICYER